MYQQKRAYVCFVINILANSIGKALLGKLIVAQLVKKSFVGPEGSLLCSQELAPDPFPEPDE
jgi:hypothetical protein